MVDLMKANTELFRRAPDERFSSLTTLWTHCHEEKQRSQDRWKSPKDIILDNSMTLCAGMDGSYQMNDWSFSQVCKMAGVAKDTVNRLSQQTASLVLGETMPRGNKPLQIVTSGDTVRSIHGTQYTRLWNADLLSMVREFAVDFQPPQTGMNGATGLYCGEQDMFVFMIDPLGWVEIDGENYAPGFFLWNSEVGRRSLGIQTFWFQAVCQNHIVWDATEVVEWTRKHTAKVGEGIPQIRTIIERLVEKRDARKDGFVKVIRKAMQEKLGDDAEEALTALTKNGIGRSMAKKALEIAEKAGRFTIWSLVDALTRIAGETQNAGDRIEADQKAAQLLELVS
jgi:histone H3/H4